MDARRVPIVVVGAGPTGLMLACQLARFGVDFVIIDSKDGPTRESRALVVHARSLELYDALGVGDEALGEGYRVDAVNLFVRGVGVERLPLATVGQQETAHPYLLVLEQSRNEALLLRQLERTGGSVRWQTSIEALSQNSDGVELTVRDDDGRAWRMRCDWLVGCDGARSFVREACGLEFAGGTYQNAFYVADVRVDGDLPAGEVVPSFSEESFALFIPMAGERRYRVVGPFPSDLDGDGVDDGEPGLMTTGPDGRPLQFEAIEAAIRRQMDVAVRFSDVAWFSAYRVHHRCVDRFRSGRCFVAGDSAHVHSPVGAQGMNTGLQDAANLGWKLALVVSGRAAPPLLDSYHDERWPVAQSLLRTTDNAFRFVISRAAPVRALRLQVFPRLAARALELPRLRRALFRRLSQIGIGYRHSRLVEPANRSVREAVDALVHDRLKVRAGDRLPFALIAPPLAEAPTAIHRRLRNPGFHVLLLDRLDDPSPLVASWRAQLDAAGAGPFSVHPLTLANGAAALFDAFGIDGTAVVVVRPDQHVGFVARRFDLGAVMDWVRHALLCR
ncbi:MAG: FAD-dependent monooxygenase [Burkholderiaceae bacterium]